MKTESLIACVKRNLIPEKYLQSRVALPIDENELDSIFPNIEFLERSYAENEPSYKQIIPYVAVRNLRNEILIYQRNGSEKRLIDFWSLGWGGHIEKSDFDGNLSLSENILKSARRELEEELNLKINNNIVFKGIINEEITNVGNTHIGLVYALSADFEHINYSNEIKQAKFISINKIKEYDFELWSLLALDLLQKE